MTQDARIIALGKRAKEALDELNAAIAAAAPDAEKEAIAERFNKISEELAKLGGWGLP